MKLTSFFLLCLIGATPVARSAIRTFHHKYHLILNKYLSWPDAQSYCRMTYTDLATITTNDDWIRLNKEAASKFYTGAGWIGLYNDVNSWRWSLNELPLKNSTYINWAYAQPNNNLEACAVITVYGLWEDNVCTALKPFICYNGNFNGSDKFVRISALVTWPEAQTYCRTHHRDLASSLNSSDNDLLKQLRDLQGDSWIGLYRDAWKWSDGTNATNIPWVLGQPDNYYGIENCASHYNNLFFDYYCSQTGNFFCHTILPVREKQIMKLQVKYDGSVFDSVMQSSILQQIKKKLEEKGLLENSTVTWRKQPDGNIFQKKNKDEL